MLISIRNDLQVDGTLSPVSMHAGHGMDTLDNDTTGRRKVINIIMIVMIIIIIIIMIMMTMMRMR